MERIKEENGKTRIAAAKCHSSILFFHFRLRQFTLNVVCLFCCNMCLINGQKNSLLVQVLFDLIATRGETHTAFCLNGASGLESKLYLKKGIPFSHFMFSLRCL